MPSKPTMKSWKGDLLDRVSGGLLLFGWSLRYLAELASQLVVAHGGCVVGHLDVD